jgi:protein Tex
VVESCVNFVGVDLNTASPSLLRHVAGLNQLIARRIAEWREQHGRFNSRQQLLEVAGVGPATFTQAAGFLRIADGDEPLDTTSIHPESYEAAHRILERRGVDPAVLITESAELGTLRRELAELDAAAIAGELAIGELTCRDILDALARPGRDPRSERPGPAFRKGILKLDDLAEGLELTGTVLNVVDFGAFVDIGLKDSGLVHVSQMAARYVRSPHDVVAVGDRVAVWVMGVDHERRRVSLTMVRPGTPRETSRDERTPATVPVRLDAASGSNGASPEASGANGSDATRPPSRPPASQPHRRQDESAHPLPAEVLNGREPLRGFDELKELWKHRR